MEIKWSEIFDQYISLVFILLVALASFGSTEQRDYNLIWFIIRLTLVSFKTSLKQVTISFYK